MTTKVCIGCDTEKELSAVYFHRDKGRKSGFRERCKECRTSGKANLIIDGKKKCHGCKQVLSTNLFHKVKRKHGTVCRPKCKSCRNKLSREYGNKTRNTPENCEKRRLYQQHKRETDPSFRIRQNLSRRINAFLKKDRDSQSTLSLLGCSILELKMHLEDQFQDGMSWENYGRPNGDYLEGWHIDHIKPCALFNLEDASQQKECFHYTNLQPLWAEDNLSKGDKYAP